MQTQRIPGRRLRAAFHRSILIDLGRRSICRSVRDALTDPDSSTVDTVDDQVDAFILEILLSRFPAPLEHAEIVRRWERQAPHGHAAVDIADAATRLEGDGLVWQVGPVLGVTTAAIRAEGLRR